LEIVQGRDIVTVIVLFISGLTVTASLYNHAATSARRPTKTSTSQKAARLIVRNLSFKVCVQFIFPDIGEVAVRYPACEPGSQVGLQAAIELDSVMECGLSDAIQLASRSQTSSRTFYGRPM